MLRIGNASGYWGDDPSAIERQLNGGRLDYLTLDFLAETTMSILQKQRAANPELGYAMDFVSMLSKNLGKALKQKVRIISNAGGMNPEGCAQAILKVAGQQGLSPKIAVVTGDNVLPILSKDSFPPNVSNLLSANAYLGATPIVEALMLGADLVITGRVADGSLALAPMVHEFHWRWNDWNKLSSGMVAGHILECGAQVTGGNFTDWQKVPSFSEMGFPIVEVENSGDFVVTKHPETGGLVTVETVKEQLVYEIGDPSAYLSPDVVVDFCSVHLEQTGENRVHVSGVTGGEPTDRYKVSVCYDNGFKCVGSLPVSGPNAREKAQSFASQFWQACPKDFEDTLTEIFGSDDLLLRLGARTPDKKKIATFSKLIPAFLLSGPPGITLLMDALPKVHEVISFFPGFIPKTALTPQVVFLSEGTREQKQVPGALSGKFRVEDVRKKVQTAEKPQPVTSTGNIELSELCFARSGDKGDSVNIGVLARSPHFYGVLRDKLTAQFVKNCFQQACAGVVTRYEMDNLQGLNFVLEKSLGGGGMTSLRMDALGKMFAQTLLREKIEYHGAR